MPAKVRVLRLLLVGDISAFVVAAILLGIFDLVLGILRGSVPLRGALLGFGIQISVGFALGMLTACIRRGLATKPVASLRRAAGFVYFIGVLSFPLAATLLLAPTHPGRVALLLVLCAAVVGTARWHALRTSTRALCGHGVAGFVSCAIFAIAFEPLILLVRSEPGINTRFFLVLGVIVASHAFTYVLSGLFTLQRKPITRLAAVGFAFIAVGLLWFPVQVYPNQYPSLRSATYVLAFFLFASAASERLAWRHILKAATVTVIATFLGLAFLHPLSATTRYLASQSLFNEPLLRESGVLAISARRYVSTLPPSPPSEPPLRSAPFASTLDSAIIVTIDTLRYDHAGYSGLAPQDMTPTVDAIARGSQRFHRAYTPGGWTALAISSLLWSKYPKELQLRPVLRKTVSPRTEPDRNLAEVLASRGWQTIAIVNDQGTNVLSPAHGISRGFDQVEYASTRRTEDSDDKVIDAALHALSRVRDDKFLMWLHLFGPHRPYRVRPGLPTSYASDILETDAQLGRLWAALRDRGLLGRVVLVVTADHGEGLGERGYLGHGLDAHEETARIPLLVHASGLQPADHRQEVDLVDVAPTVLSLVGEPVPNSFRGFSLPGKRSRPVFYETYKSRSIMRTSRESHVIAAIQDQHKAVYDLRRHTFALYDLAADPGEKHPLLLGDARIDEWGTSLIAQLLQWWQPPTRRVRDAPGVQ